MDPYHGLVRRNRDDIDTIIIEIDDVHWVG